MASSATPASGASPKPRRPRPAPASTPGTVSGNIPFSVQVDPLSMRVAAQLVGAGQPVGQPAPAAPAAQAPAPKKNFIARYWVPLLVVCAVVGIAAGAIASYFWGSSKPSASAASAASANVNLSVPSAPQQVASTPTVSTSSVVVDPLAPAICPVPSVNVVNTNNCGVSPGVKPPVVHPTLRPQQPQSAPTTAGVPAPSAPATAAVPEGGCRYFAGANFIRKGGTTPEKAGTLLYMITNKQIVEASEKFMVDLREQYPTWLAKKDAHDALCLVLNTKWADENQAAEGRQIK